MLVIALAAIALTLAGIVLPGRRNSVLWAPRCSGFLVFRLPGHIGNDDVLVVFAGGHHRGHRLSRHSFGGKKRGGSKAGAIGSAIGLVAGLTVFQIPGMLAGCFPGRFGGEMLSGRDFNQAASIAVGALFGYATATVFKLGVLAVYG